jgi:iron complex outermembrane receptor protein
MRRILPAVITALVLSLVVVSPTLAAVPQGQPGQPGQAGQQGQTSQQGDQGEQQEQQRYEERVVVTASRIEQLLLDAPTAITILDAAMIEASPAGNYADLLRGVPGLNVSQTSARDINITSRAPTNTLATTQLVLMDGRTVYQDFFGFVLWDLLPVAFNEIEQIEVQRGPSSAVWGANAMTGVINVITKSPRRLGNATSVRGGGGEVGTGFFSALHSGVRNEWAYKVSGSYYQQDAWPRPENLSGVVFPDSENRGTKQPKFDGRVDYQIDPQSNVSFSGGYAGTGGIIFTGIGPFDIKDGSWSSYLRADYNRDSANVRFYANLLDADSFNLLSPLDFDFKTGTYDWSAQNTSIVQDARHIFVYGGNFRYLTNDLSIAPNADDRKEGGAFIQDSWTPIDQILVTAGVRVDGFSSIDNAVWSPRIGAQFRPIAGQDHAVRISWGRAFRAPSVINNFLETTIFNTIDLSPLTPALGFNPGLFTFPIGAVGNPDLVEEQLDQIEVGYRAVVKDVAIDFAYYYSETKDNIDFYPNQFYSPFDPPPAWPLPPFILALLPPLPKEFTYRNIGLVKHQGVEIGVRGRVASSAEVFGTYTWQKTPELEGINPSEFNIPPENLFSIGVNGTHRGFLYSATVNYQDEGFWADVLDSRFHGITEAMTTLNLTLGYEFRNVSFSMRGTNLTNEAFQQHYVGDVIGRRIVAEAGVNFDWDNR